LIEGALSRREARYYLNIPFGLTSLSLDISWLVIAPVVMWALATVYTPIIESGLSSLQAWIAATIILICIFACIAVHALAHAFAARILGYHIPARIPVHLLGDIAQVWPLAPNAGAEALTSISGVAVQGLLTAIAYILWNAQINHFVTLISFFLIFFNLGIIALNLTPAFPFDGGRLLRSIFWKLLDVPVAATKAAFYIGLFISLAFMVWSVFLFSQHTSLSLETSLATLILALLIFYSLILVRRTDEFPIVRPTKQGLASRVVRVSVSILFSLLLFSVTFSLLPMNYGLEAPGFTASVEPMVQMPQQYRYSSKGSFLISSVILQSPILSAEWVYGHLDSSIKLMPQERIVPVTTTVQAVAKADYQMLLDSETTAAVVGLRMAGYPTDVVEDHAELPFPVKILHQKTNGGPSAGLMFTLGIYDLVTPKDLTGGRNIAGTGTIDLDGRVGPIGGVQQKVVAAERAGAQYFLTPSWNYQEALPYAKNMQVIKVDTVKEAIDFLNSMAPLSEQ
jgi:Lon-like protease